MHVNLVGLESGRCAGTIEPKRDGSDKSIHMIEWSVVGGIPGGVYPFLSGTIPLDPKMASIGASQPQVGNGGWSILVCLSQK